jgi:NitT/TauT family transport system permease protein
MAVLWIVLWQAAAALIRNQIIFVGPLEAGKALLAQVALPDFWVTIACSSGRIFGGFLLAFAAGLCLGIVSSASALLQEFLEPAVALLQSVPVASFVILALIWIGSTNLSVLICFLVVFPLIYRSTLQGMATADRALLEMAEVYRMGRWRRLCYIYRPALLPCLLTAGRTACGMAWKSGIAAEVIGVPSHSIGEKLYMAKIYLSTADLFAWTLVIIVVSKVFERCFLWLLGLLDVRGTR